MSNLKLMIKNEMEDDKSLGKRLAKLIGYSNPTPLYKFLNEAEREIDFQQVLSIVQDLFPDREFDIMSEYILTLKPTQRCARESLEYATINKLNDLLVEQINKLSSCSNKESQEWAETYRVHWLNLNGELNDVELIEAVNEMTFKTDEMKVFSKIIQFYSYNDLKLIDIMRDMGYLIDNGFNLLKEGFVKLYFECRFITIKASISLHTNNMKSIMEKIDEFSKKITNHNLLNIMYVFAGNSFLFNDYDKSLSYFELAAIHSNAVNNQKRTDQAYKSINLLNSFWGKKAAFIEINDDSNSLLADKAYNMCNFSKDKGMEMLLEVDHIDFTEQGKGFYNYYLGVATGNDDFFYESIEHFNEVGEKFFKKLPLIELEKLGVKKSILKALSV